MKKRTSSMSRRIVSLLMSMVLTLTLVTPAAFAEGMGAYANGEGTAVTTPADIATQEGEDTSVSVAQRTVTVKQYHANEAYEVKIVVGVEADGTTEKLDTTYTINADTKTVTLRLTKDGNAGEPVYIKTALNDVLVTEGENQTPALTTGEPTLEYTLPNEGDVTLYYGTQADFNAPVAQRKVTVEKYRTDAAYEVKIVVGVEEDGITEKLDTTYTIDADTKTVTLKLTTDGYEGEPIYIKTALDDVLVTEDDNKTPKTPALTKDTTTLEYPLPEDGDVTLYYGTQADFVSAWYGDGTATDYYIRTAEELAHFAQLVNGGNNFAGKTVTLARDIDLSAVCHPADEESGIAEASWTPIGTSQKRFAGKFDGQGYTIGNMSVTVANNSGQAGLFGWLSGTVQNLIVTGEIKLEGCKTPLFVGSIAGQTMKSTITKCNSRVNITVQSFSKAASVGGLAGAGNGTVKNCLNEGRILVESTQAVGNTIIGGIASAGCAVNACWNTGEITVEVPRATGRIYVGGMIGQNGNNVLVNCYNGGAIKVKSNADSNMECLVGGIAGKAGSKGVRNSYNLGDVMCTKAGTAYGISSAAVTNSYYMYFDQKEFGLRVKHLRRKHGLTQEQLADALYISAAYLSKIECGQRGISIDLLLDLAAELGVSVDFLLNGIPRTTYSARMLMAQIRELLDRVESSEMD